MSDYQNSDTAKWDAQEVRKQTSSGQGPKPKKKRRLGWLGYLAGVIVASFLLAGIGWLAVNDVCALNKAPLTATIEVESGDSVGTVAGKLKKAGLINSKLLFMITSPVFHASRYIQPGVYELNTDMDFNCLIKSMQPTGGVAATVTVTIPPSQAYGESDPELVFTVDRAQVPDHIPLTVGVPLQLSNEQGQMDVTITEVTDEEITLDANHPLAGKELTFEIEIVSVN